MEITFTNSDNNKDNNTVKQQDNGSNADDSKTYMNITVLDSSPIVILFGPKDCGKTTVLLRMLRYFRKKTDSNNSRYCDFVLDRSFRKGKAYTNMCKKIEDYLNDEKKITIGTPPVEYLLARITERGDTIFQFLEAAGEDYVPMPNDNHIDNEADFKPYLKKITELPNKRIWVFFFNLKWKEDNEVVRKEYFKRIRKAKDELLKPNDSVIILFNKADESKEYCEGVSPNLRQFKNWARRLYCDDEKDCFSLFAIPRFLIGDKMPDSVAFSSGKHVKNEDNDNEEEWEQGPSSYCVALEKAINAAL